MERTDNKTASDNPKSKQPSGSALGGLVFKLVAVIGIGAWVGYWIDTSLNLRIPIFTLLGVLLSLTSVIVYLIRQTK